MIQLPQYPSYFDSDTAEKQIEVAREYLGKLKEALENQMSHIKISDLDDDTRDYLESLQIGLEESESAIIRIDDSLQANDHDISFLWKYVNQFNIEILDLLSNALRANNEESLTQKFADKTVQFGSLNAFHNIQALEEIKASGDVSTIGGTLGAYKNTSNQGGDLYVANQASIQGNTFCDAQLEVTGSSFLDGYTFVGDENRNITSQLIVNGNTFVNNQLQVFGPTFANDDVNVEYGNLIAKAKTVDGVTKGGTIRAVEKVLNPGTPQETKVGGDVEANKYRIAGLLDSQYLRLISQQVKDANGNTITIHYLGIPDGVYP